MDKEYKKFVMGYLFGMISGTPESMKKLMTKSFNLKFHRDDFSFTITKTDKTIKDEGKLFGLWIGTMCIILKVDDEEYSLTRDWSEEYDNDKKHADYLTDTDFYESDKCYSSIKYNKLIDLLDNG